MKNYWTDTRAKREAKREAFVTLVYTAIALCGVLVHFEAEYKLGPKENAPE